MFVQCPRQWLEVKSSFIISGRVNKKDHFIFLDELTSCPVKLTMIDIVFVSYSINVNGD